MRHVTTLLIQHDDDALLWYSVNRQGQAERLLYYLMQCLCSLSSQGKAIDAQSLLGCR